MEKYFNHSKEPKLLSIDVRTEEVGKGEFGIVREATLEFSEATEANQDGSAQFIIGPLTKLALPLLIVLLVGTAMATKSVLWTLLTVFGALVIITVIAVRASVTSGAKKAEFKDRGLILKLRTTETKSGTKLGGIAADVYGGLPVIVEDASRFSLNFHTLKANTMEDDWVKEVPMIITGKQGRVLVPNWYYKYIEEIFQVYRTNSKEAINAKNKLALLRKSLRQNEKDLVKAKEGLESAERQLKRMQDDKNEDGTAKTQKMIDGYKASIESLEAQTAELEYSIKAVEAKARMKDMEAEARAKMEGKEV